MPMRARYIDPRTKSYRVKRGQYVHAPAGVAWAFAQLMLDRGSVPGYPNMGGRLRSGTHVGAGTVRRLEAIVDEVLRPGVGAHFDGYSRSVWMEGTRPVVEVTIRVAGEAYVFTVPQDDDLLGAT